MSRIGETRIYVVESTNGGAERLVRASNRSRAVKVSVTARIASQSDLERLLASGVAVEGEQARQQRARRAPR